VEFRSGTSFAGRDAFPVSEPVELEQPGYSHAEISITADTRDYPGHPSRGGLYRAGRTAFIDRNEGVSSFTRYEAEGLHFFPMAAGTTLAVRGWLVSTGETDRVIPFYALPSLGGHNTLRGFSSYRFHDRNMLLLNVEGRIPLMTHVDGALFVDAGNVAPRLSDLNLAKTSYGFGLRLHSRRTTFARVDVAHSSEGWRFLLKLSDPLHSLRHSRRTAQLPLMP
jgi:outer membrane protein assembly factor BamA